MKRTGASCKFVSRENLVQNIFRKIKKSRKDREYRQTLISVPAYFLSASIYFCRKDYGSIAVSTRLYLHAVL